MRIGVVYHNLLNPDTAPRAPGKGYQVAVLVQVTTKPALRPKGLWIWKYRAIGIINVMAKRNEGL